MIIQFQVTLDVDDLTASRFIAADPKHLVKMTDLLQSNRPLSVVLSVPKEIHGETE